MTSLLQDHLERRATNINELLSFSRQAIIDCTESSEDAVEQAQQIFATIRVFLFDFERGNPAHSSEIQQWWKEVLQSLISKEAHYLQIEKALEVQKRLARFEARFQQAWGLSSCQILQSKYTPPSGFGRKTMQALVQFAERSSCEDGQAALEEAVTLRLHSDDDRPYRTREPYLVPSDIKKAEEVYNSNQNRVIENEYVTARRKRKRRAEEDRAFSVNHRPLATLIEQNNDYPSGVGNSTLNTTHSTRDRLNATTSAEYVNGRGEELERERNDDEDASDTSHHEESNAPIQPLGDHNQINEIPSKNTNTGNLELDDQMNAIDALRDKSTHVAQESEQSAQDIPAQSHRHSETLGEAPLYEDDTSPRIEIGRGTRPSRRLTDHHESLDNSLILSDLFTPKDIERTPSLGCPLSASSASLSLQQQTLDTSSHQRVLTPTPQGEDTSYLLSQFEDQCSPTSVTRSHMTNLRPGFPTSNLRLASSRTVGEDGVPFSHSISRTEPKASHPNEVDFNSDTESSMNATRSASAQALLALQTPQRYELPTTDLAGALSTLKPGKCLSASAVELVLSTCCPEIARIIDSASFDLGAKGATSSNLQLCGDHVVKVILPINYRNHWTLAILDRRARIITHYNSLCTEDSFKDALERTLPIFMSNIVGEKALFTVAYKEPCTQQNAYDCGVHILVTALCAFINSAPLTLVDTKLWRLIFRALLTETLETESRLESMIDMPDDAIGEVVEMNLDNYRARLTTSRLSIALAEKALDLLNHISNQMVGSTLFWSQLPNICQCFLSAIEGGLSELSPYSRVFESLPNLDQFHGFFQAGLIKGDKLRKASLRAERGVRAAIGSVQKAKDIRVGAKRRLSLRVKEMADSMRERGLQNMAAAEAEIEASKQLRKLLDEE